MALIDFQTVLGRMLREQNSDNHVRGVRLDEGESQYLQNLRDTAEFRFCASIQRSWCIARATKAAHLTLSLLPQDERERLLNEWVDLGAGAQSFYGVEGELFLDFIGKHLTDRLHELTICQFERATLRARNGADEFIVPDASSLKRPECLVQRGRYAGLVRFDIDPQDSLDTNRPLAHLFSAGLIVMFSPGVPQLWHEPSPDEVKLWDALESPAPVSTLVRRGHSFETLQTLLSSGTIQYADGDRHRTERGSAG
jgi:hypothetical protein